MPRRLWTRPRRTQAHPRMYIDVRACLNAFARLCLRRMMAESRLQSHHGMGWAEERGGGGGAVQR